MKQKKLHAGISAIIAVILAALILGSGSVYFLIKNKSKKNQIRELENSTTIEKQDATETKSPSSTPTTLTVPPTTETDDAKPEIEGTVLAGTEAKLVDFNKSDYEKALRGEKLIVLYFYADWCPICQAELPNLYSAFNELRTKNVIGFRVNFNDDMTDTDEKALAQEFSVSYQHTKIFILQGRRVLKDPDTWQKDKYLQEITKIAP